MLSGAKHPVLDFQNEILRLLRSLRMTSFGLSEAELC
jgi:hypothetical protein